MGDKTSITTTDNNNTKTKDNKNNNNPHEICAICLDELDDALGRSPTNLRLGIDDELGPSKLVVRGIGAEIEAEIGARSAPEP